LIFHRVVKQCGDGHLFVAAILNDDGSDTQKMADVWAFGALAKLPSMQFCRVGQSLPKLSRKDAR
jgi:hypothetical protein